MRTVRNAEIVRCTMQISLISQKLVQRGSMGIEQLLLSFRNSNLRTNDEIKLYFNCPRLTEYY